MEGEAPTPLLYTQARIVLIDESYVNELKLCLGAMPQRSIRALTPAIAARSAKVFYYLSNALRSGTEGWNSSF